MEKAKKPYKIGFFKVVIQNVKNQKNGFLAKIAWHYLCQQGRKNAHFRAHYLFWPKCFFDLKQCKPGKTIKIVVSAEIAQNQKWHLFFEKGVFLIWVKKWVLLTVILKSCVFFWKHYFYSVFSKTQLFKSKNGMLKKTKKLWKIVGCFWTWQNGVFWVCFFWGFNVIVVCFWCVRHSSRSVKNACFPQFFGLLWGGFFLFIFGFGGFRCFCVSCVCFCFCVAFVSVLFALFLFCCWIVFWCWFLFCFCFCFFLFFLCFFVLVFLFLIFVVLFFFGGFKGQLRWPKGPPHLTLNPPYFLFVFCFCCWRV